MMYTFWINRVPQDNFICSWIRSKCAVESKTKLHPDGKKWFNYRFQSTKKDWADSIHAFLIQNNCEVTEIVATEFKTYA